MVVEEVSGGRQHQIGGMRLAMCPVRQQQRYACEDLVKLAIVNM